VDSPHITDITEGRTPEHTQENSKTGKVKYAMAEPTQENSKTLERSARCYRAMTCSPVMGRKVGDILQILGGGLIP
jgi:hypothetical protein